MDFYDPFVKVGIYLYGLPMSQTFADVLLWERILDSHPPATLTEIGTGEGGFSRYLATQCAYRGAKFATFDIVPPAAEVPNFQQADAHAEVARVMATVGRPAILFCDGGDKAREMNLYAPLLAPGDVLVVHDWNREVGPEDVPPCLWTIHADWCYELRSLSRVFVRAPDPQPDPEPEPEPALEDGPEPDPEPAEEAPE